MKDNLILFLIIILYAMAAAYCFDLFYGRLKQRLGVLKFIILLFIIVTCLIIILFFIGK